MSKQVEYIWYVEPLDPFTNHVISDRVSADENYFEQIQSGGMTFENVWRCPRRVITSLENSRRQLELKFRVYVQAGGGKIREWTFKKKKNAGKPRKTKAAN